MGDARTRDDVLAGAVFLAFGAAFAYASTQYDVGTLFHMGPGYFPLVLGIILAGFGVAIIGTALATRQGIVPVAQAPAPVADALTDGHPPPAPTDAAAEPDPAPAAVPGAAAGSAEEDEEPGRGTVPWARGGLVVLAILVFGYTIGGLGLVPALFVTTLLTALAGHGTSVKGAIVISIGLTALCIVVFVLVLQLRLPLLGPWLGG